MQVIPLPALLGAGEAERGGSELVPLQLPRCPWELLLGRVSGAHPAGAADPGPSQGSLQLHKAAAGLPWSPALLHHSDHRAAAGAQLWGQDWAVPELSHLPEREMP